MGGEAFKRRLNHSVAVLITAWNSFVLLLKCVIANVLKSEAHLKIILKRVRVTMHSLVMSPCSHDLIKTQVD